MQSYPPFGNKNLTAPGNNRDFRDVPAMPIVGSWQHRVSPGIVPVIVGDQFDADEADEEFDTPIVTIHEDIQEAAGG